MPFGEQADAYVIGEVLSLLGKLDSYVQENETGPLPLAIHKINSRQIKGLNLRPETIKFVEENIRGQVLDINLSDDFLDLTSRHRQQKQK